MRILGKHATPITSVESWLQLAPPKKKELHWKDYASAKELARAWFPRTGGGGVVPQELSALLGSHAMTGGASFSRSDGWAELRVKFDGYDGERRNTDLALVCEVSSVNGVTRRAAVSIEAKAYESFGRTVRGAIRASESRRAMGKASYGDARVRDLLHALLPPPDAVAPAALGLHYQLLTATAGALAYTAQENADLAVLVIHEFVHADHTQRDMARLDANERALAAFIPRLTHGLCSHLPFGTLVGPFYVPGSKHIPADMPLVVGKVRRELPYLPS